MSWKIITCGFRLLPVAFKVRGMFYLSENWTIFKSWELTLLVWFDLITSFYSYYKTFRIHQVAKNKNEIMEKFALKMFMQISRGILKNIKLQISRLLSWLNTDELRMFGVLWAQIRPRIGGGFRSFMFRGFLEWFSARSTTFQMRKKN